MVPENEVPGRAPQSKQSLPWEQVLDEDPGPPSSQMPFATPGQLVKSSLQMYPDLKLQSVSHEHTPSHWQPPSVV